MAWRIGAGTRPRFADVGGGQTGDAFAVAAGAKERRQQASAIGFWDAGDGTWILANHSSLPVYKILVGSIGQIMSSHEWAGFIIDFEASRPITEFRGFLGPGQDQTFHMSLDEHDPRACMSFVDNAGVMWFRSDFELTEVDELDDYTRTELATAVMRARFDEL